MLSPKRLSFARLPTPIHALKNLSEELGKEMWIWRDDLTGFSESGNKVRKLEFLLADAQAQGCDWIITCGGPQSNHTRATAVMARQLGLEVSLLILPKAGFNGEAPANGNLLMNEIFASRITWLTQEEYQKQGSLYEPFLEREAERLKSLGKKPYVIPLGGSNPIGCLGYLYGFEEMLKTWRSSVTTASPPDSLFCALGSAGTFVGLQLGLQKHDLPIELYGVNVLGTKETADVFLNRLTQSASRYFHSEIPVNEKKIFQGYAGAGYAIASDEDLAFYIKLARSEGIWLDPCYTGKAFQGMISEIKKDPTRFGDRILFLHSGGGFGNFAYAEQFQKVMRSGFEFGSHEKFDPH